MASAGTFSESVTVCSEIKEHLECVAVTVVGTPYPFRLKSLLRLVLKRIVYVRMPLHAVAMIPTPFYLLDPPLPRPAGMPKLAKDARMHARRKT